MSSIFGELRVRYDPWEVDYGDQTPLELADEAEAEDERIDLEVERPAGSWAPIVPTGDPAPRPRVVFIDGVVRPELRIRVCRDEQMIYGAFGSYAVGAVELTPASAAFGAMRPFRTAVLGAGVRLPGDVRVRPSLVYEARTTQDPTIHAPLAYLQNAMRAEEARLAAELCREDTLVIVDGRLSLGAKGQGEALGYIKRIHDLYLPSRYLRTLIALPARARTPLFGIQSAKAGFSRLAWFQRLEAPPLGATELHGIVRLEVANVDRERARELADATTLWLPRLVPRRARDPRSPQNLLPIGALEQRLRIHLGEAELFRRWIETLIAKEASRE
ncbi:MAG TPA: hypothetical protein VNO30_42525 [Kofleriaceae bacterium]|nr:hypothetical protein [Kofleriaceae bacterium]